MPADAGWSIPLSVPISLASTTIDGLIYVDNDGDVETWPTIRITGPCDDPEIENVTTGEKIEITQDQDAGDYIKINMEEATVVWYDSSAGLPTKNIIETISDGSTFWPLARGNNTLHIVADGAAGGTISVHFFKRYQQGA